MEGRITGLREKVDNFFDLASDEMAIRVDSLKHDLDELAIELKTGLFETKESLKRFFLRFFSTHTNIFAKNEHFQRTYLDSVDLTEIESRIIDFKNMDK